jgi:hypothetical protein
MTIFSYGKGSAGPGTLSPLHTWFFWEQELIKAAVVHKPAMLLICKQRIFSQFFNLRNVTGIIYRIRIIVQTLSIFYVLQGLVNNSPSFDNG